MKRCQAGSVAALRSVVSGARWLQLLFSIQHIHVCSASCCSTQTFTGNTTYMKNHLMQATLINDKWYPGEFGLLKTIKNIFQINFNA